MWLTLGQGRDLGREESLAWLGSGEDACVSQREVEWTEKMSGSQVGGQ